MAADKTRTSLSVLREPQFYEKFQVPKQSSQLYREVTELLYEHFQKTLEQSQSKFRSFQASCCQGRRGHSPEPCAFQEETKALLVLTGLL